MPVEIDITRIPSYQIGEEQGFEKGEAQGEIRKENQMLSAIEALKAGKSPEQVTEELTMELEKVVQLRDLIFNR